MEESYYNLKAVSTTRNNELHVFLKKQSLYTDYNVCIIIYGEEVHYPKAKKKEGDENGMSSN